MFNPSNTHISPSRSDSEYIKDVVKPFDWTYTTDYKGTVFGKEGAQMNVSVAISRVVNLGTTTKLC